MKRVRMALYRLGGAEKLRLHVYTSRIDGFRARALEKQEVGGA